MQKDKGNAWRDSSTNMSNSTVSLIDSPAPEIQPASQPGVIFCRPHLMLLIWDRPYCTVLSNLPECIPQCCKLHCANGK
eukprot:scaffold107900_cov17-Tisochrysis_lutea.AAC.1